MLQHVKTPQALNLLLTHKYIDILLTKQQNDRLSLDRAPAVHLNHFEFTATEAQLTMLREISVSDAAMDFVPDFIPQSTMIQVTS
jgi:hypothetical protein